MRICENCNLTLDQDKNHEDDKDCIKALQQASLRQRKLAETLSFDLSHRYLAAIEGLAQNPDCGIPYTVKAEGGEMVVHPKQVAGVFAAIAKRFKEAGNWTPLARTKAAAAQAGLVAGKLAGQIERMLTLEARGELELSDELKKELRDRLSETEALLDPARFESHPG